MSSRSRSHPTAPRPLNEHEFRILRAILVDDCPGVTELRVQIDAAHVSQNWTPEGSPSIDISVDSAIPRAPLEETILPVDARVYDRFGNYIGELIVWLSDGRISALEYSWLTDEMPYSLPEVEALRVSVK